MSKQQSFALPISLHNDKTQLMIDFSKLVFIGRYNIQNSKAYIYNGGSGFSFLMKGTGFELVSDSIDQDGYYYIIIDKDYKNKRKVLVSNSKPFVFGKEGLYQVDIIKANEANDNTLVLKDIKVNGTLFTIQNEPKKKVVVYGDSTIAGFGILAKTGAADIHNCDAVEDFCFQALYELNMDMDIFSASGYGLTFSQYTFPMDMGIIDYFDKLKVHSEISWNNQSKNDLLIISLGTNDNAFIQGHIEKKDELIDLFKINYRKLIDAEMSKNPEIKVLMVYGTLTEVTAYPLIEETYKYLKHLYNNLYIHKFNGDCSAISNHAFVNAHKRMAEELKNEIKNILKI